VAPRATKDLSKGAIGVFAVLECLSNIFVLELTYSGNVSYSFAYIISSSFRNL